VNNSHITGGFDIGDNPLEVRWWLILHSHPIDHPDYHVIAQYRGTTKKERLIRLKQLRERMDYINSGGF
tara:strand:- start:191 stop:397 length:207 start_codon:yes stop_codon:yes gene_type:complete